MTNCCKNCGEPVVWVPDRGGQWTHYRADSSCGQPEPEGEATLCSHDWEPFWDGSLGYSATDCCRVCGDYRPTPDDPPVQRWETTLDDSCGDLG